MPMLHRHPPGLPIRNSELDSEQERDCRSMVRSFMQWALFRGRQVVRRLVPSSRSYHIRCSVLTNALSGGKSRSCVGVFSASYLCVVGGRHHKDKPWCVRMSVSMLVKGPDTVVVVAAAAAAVAPFGRLMLHGAQT